MKRWVTWACGLVAMSVAPVLMAQEATNWPNKPVTFVVGFPPGTATDSVARVLAERFTTRLGPSFVIDNKPGQGGSVGAATVAKAKPDGYTFVVSATAPMSINPYVYPKLSYDPLKDFSPVGIHTWLPYAIVVNANSKINTYADLRAAALAPPVEQVGQPVERLRAEHDVDERRPLDDAGAFLAPMLQGVEPERGVRRSRVVAVNAKDPALVVKFVQRPHSHPVMPDACRPHVARPAWRPQNGVSARAKPVPTSNLWSLPANPAEPARQATLRPRRRRAASVRSRTSRGSQPRPGRRAP